MSNNKSNGVALQDPSNAVDDYLDRLLDDSVSESAYDISPERSGGTVVSAPHGEDTDDMLPTFSSETLASDTQYNEEASRSEDSSDPAADAEACPGLEGEAAETPAQAETDMDSKVVSAPDTKDLDPKLDEKAPSVQLYACFKFQAMGINFAVPAEHYLGDFPCPEDIASEQKGPEGVLGGILVGGKRIRIADIAVLVIPKSRRGALRPGAGKRRVLQVGRGDWGIVCEGEVERIELSSENIHWRTEQGKRQWLAGTIVDQKCALLDIGVVERMLDQGKWQE